MIIFTILFLLFLSILAIRYSSLLFKHPIEIIILGVSFYALHSYGFLLEEVFFLITISVLVGVLSFMSSYDYVLGTPNNVKLHSVIFYLGLVLLFWIAFFSFASFFESVILFIILGLPAIFTRNILLAVGNKTHFATVYGVAMGYLSILNGIVYYFYYFQN